MTRRALLLQAFWRDPLVGAWNEFADAGNEWAAKTNRGISDAALMRKMTRLWQRLTKTEGWLG